MAQTKKKQSPRWTTPEKFPFRPVIAALVVLIVLGIVLNITSRRNNPDDLPSWIDPQIVAVNGTGRRGEALEGVNGIVVHYVGNPGTTAQQNRDFYDHPDTEVSSHFLVGLEGEIIQCIPLGEKSSASNDRNADTISIEVCHPDETGEFTDASYQSLVKLTQWLCDRYDLSKEQVIRHYDVTGKLCPLYFVEHPEAWEEFLSDIG